MLKESRYFILLGTKSLKLSVHFALTAHLDLDEPHFKCSAVTAAFTEQRNLRLWHFLNSFDSDTDKPRIEISPHFPVLAPSTSS